MNFLRRRAWLCAAAALLVGSGWRAAQAAPAFAVSVCLADVEYSIACRERSSLEAARRLEQIFLDDYTTRRTTGSLRVWFPLSISASEQLRFLREVEARAVEAAARKMQTVIDRPDTPPSALPASGRSDEPAADQGQQLVQLLQRRHEDVQRWRQDAMLEARKGSNWSHDWATRTHLYKPGPALDRLVRDAGEPAERKPVARGDGGWPASPAGGSSAGGPPVAAPATTR